MKENTPFTANPPTGIFLEIVQHDRLFESEMKILRDTKVLNFVDLPHIRKTIKEWRERRARLSIYAARALQSTLNQ